MLFVDAAAFLVLMVMCFARGTPLGRWLDVRLVERPARWLGGTGRGLWICLGCAVLAVGVLIWLARGEGAVVAVMGAPDLAVWFTTFEVSTWADALAAVAMGAFAFRIRMVVGWVRTRLARGKVDEG